MVSAEYEREYFYNKKTGEAVWEKPEEVKWRASVHDEL